MRDDASELSRQLEDRWQDVLTRYWPSWTQVGKKALLTPRVKIGDKGKGKGKPRKATSSFTLNLAGQHAFHWYRFSAGVGGGMVALLYYSEYARIPDSKTEWADAFKLAREFLGIAAERHISPDEQQAREERKEQDRVARAERERKAAEAQALEDAKRVLSAKQVWQETIPLPGTHGEAYLIERGLPPVSEWPWDCSRTIRFHPGLASELEPRAGLFPALIAKVQDAFGDAIAVWQIFLDKNTPEKAPLDNPKVGRGPAGGGAVRIGGDSPRVGVGEGLETCLGFWALESFRKPVWATLSTSGMRAFDPPIFVKHVSIYPDGDKGIVHNNKIIEPPGIEAARALRDRMKTVGIGNNINEMPVLGDGLDLWNTRREHEKT